MIIWLGCAIFGWLDVCASWLINCFNQQKNWFQTFIAIQWGWACECPRNLHSDLTFNICMLWFTFMIGFNFIRLRVVPHFSSGIVERAIRERAWKSTHARKGDTQREREKNFFIFLSPAACRLFSRGLIFTRARVLLALLSLTKNGGLLVVYNFISLSFKLVIIHYHNQKQREMKLQPRIKTEPRHTHCCCCCFSMGKITRPLTGSYVIKAGRM